MGDISWTSIITAAIMGFFIVRLWPTAMHWFKNGPKGSSSDWTTFSFLMAGIVLFVILLIYFVRA